MKKTKFNFHFTNYIKVGLIVLFSVLAICGVAVYAGAITPLILTPGFPWKTVSAI
jgi:Mg/Co/Ni transporter MgtE